VSDRPSFEPVEPIEPSPDPVEMRRRARQRGGLAGAVVMGAMLGIRDVLEGPPKDPVAVVVDAPGEPGDIDADGLSVILDEVTVAAPALPPAPPLRSPRRGGRSRGR
jgi:ferric-dicitrate binding protein FerR (iron transport regulator)